MFSFARADPVDLPRSGSPLGKMELGTSVYHSGGAVLLVLVDEVLKTLLHLVDVDVRAEPKDVEVP